MDLLDFARDAWYGCIDWHAATGLAFMLGLIGLMGTASIWNGESRG